jgi:hypothetical protein
LGNATEGTLLLIERRLNILWGLYIEKCTPWASHFGGKYEKRMRRRGKFELKRKKEES